MQYLAEKADLDLLPELRGMLAPIRAVLERVRPAQVEPSETCVLTEGAGVAYAVVPHRALGGVSLVVGFDREAIDVFWAMVWNLGYHDNLDLARHPFQQGLFRSADSGDWVERAVRCFETQLVHPVEVRVTYKGAGETAVSIEYWLIKGERARLLGRRHRFWSLRRLNPFLRRRRVVGKTTLVDLHEPPVSVPSGADGWWS